MGNLNGTAHYLQVTLPTSFPFDLGGVTISISVANLVVILLMIVVFILAVVLPFPGGKKVEP